MAKKNLKKTAQELKKEVKDAKSILLDMRLEKSQNKLKNLRSIFSKRKEIARLLTQIKEMEIMSKKEMDKVVKEFQNENI